MALNISKNESKAETKAETDYSTEAEKIAFNHLKKSQKKPVFLHGTKGYCQKFGDIQVGKNKNTCKIIEVKGQGEDWDSNTNWDVPRRDISISKTEYNFLKNNPDRFEVWIVYRLKYNPNPKWNKPKIAVCKGKDLLKCKKEVRNIFIKTPNDFWKNTKQYQTRHNERR